MKTKQLLPLLVVALSLATNRLPAATDLFRSDFTGPDPAMNLPWTTTSVVPPGAAFNGWSIGSGIQPATSARANQIGFNVHHGANPSTLGEAIAAGAWFAGTITPSASTPLNWNGARVVFSFQRHSYHAPRRYAVFTSLGGFAPGDELFSTDTLGHHDEADNQFSFILPLSGYDGLTAPLEFRIVAYSATYAGHDAGFGEFAVVTTAGAHRLVLNPTPGGVITTSPGAELFESGESVTLSAQPDPGYRFGGWTGGSLTDLHRGNPLTVTIGTSNTYTAIFRPNTPPAMSIGQNLDGITDWTTARTFVDLMKYARPWMTRPTDGGAWNSQQAVPERTDGYPTQVPFDPGDGSSQIVHTILPTFEAGVHTILFEGTGRLYLIRPNTFEHQTLIGTGGTTRIEMPVDVQSRQDALFLEIHASDPNDPIRNLRFIPPRFENTYDTQPFHPQFIAEISQFPVLRFMDWGLINGAYTTHWSNSTPRHYYTQANWSGVSPEWMIELANTVRCHPWICVPHRASDDYITQLARLIRDQLAPGLRVYIEYSNETWNGAGPFTQTTWVQDQGAAAGLDSNRWVAGQFYAAQRSADVWRIFNREFGTNTAARVVKVLGAFVAGVNTTAMRMTALNNPNINPDGLQPDAVAIAPYFGVNFTPEMIPPQAAAYPTVDELVGTMSQTTIAEARNWVREHKALADRHGLRLICYEGGQHFTGLFGAEDDATLMARLHAANRDPRIGVRYAEYLDMLKGEGVDLFVNFTYTGEWSKWGSWGSREYHDQPLAESPKHQAIVHWQTTENVLQAAAARAVPTTHYPASGQLAIDLNLMPDRNYIIEQSTDLAHWNPTHIAVPIGSGTRERFMLPTTEGRQVFWRIRTVNR